MDLAVIEDAQRGCTTVQLCGELDVASAPDLRDRLLLILDRHQAPSRLFIDLSRLEFMDSSGTAVLVNADRRARVVGCTVALVAPQPAVWRVLQICGLDRHFLIFPSISAAAERMQADHHWSRLRVPGADESDRAAP